jgi:peptidyl-prolyl cis-trans isomerase A (cyclophilin A)
MFRRSPPAAQLLSRAPLAATRRLLIFVGHRRRLNLTREMMMKRIWMMLIVVSLVGLVACEKKAEKEDEKPAAASQEAEKAEKAEEPEPDPLPEAVQKVDCSVVPAEASLEISDKSKGIEKADDDKSEKAPKGEGSDKKAAADEGDDAADELPEDSPLLNPEKATETAPGVFWVNFKTTEGPIVIRFEREWSPAGVDRVYNLVKMGYYDDVAFFRVIEGFMAQFGIHGTPAVNEAWKEATIPDEEVKKSNTRGMVTFAKRNMPDSRTVQLFINYSDKNKRLDASGFAPIGEVEKCMSNVESLHAGYGEGAPRGQGPSQAKMNEEGNAYLEANFPKLDYIRETTVLAEESGE